MIFAFFKIRIKKKKSADQKPDFVMAILNKDYRSIYYSACHPFGEPVYNKANQSYSYVYRHFQNTKPTKEGRKIKTYKLFLFIGTDTNSVSIQFTLRI